MAAASVCVPRMKSSFLLPLWETLQDWQVGLTLAPFRSLLLPWVPEQVKLYVCPLRVESVFSRALGVSQK